MKALSKLVLFCLIGISVRSFAPPPGSAESFTARATDPGKAAIFAAIAIAQSEGAPEVTAEHFLKALVRGYAAAQTAVAGSSQGTANNALIKEHQTIVLETAKNLFAAAGLTDENALQTKLKTRFPAPTMRAASTVPGTQFADFADTVDAISTEMGHHHIWVPDMVLALARDNGKVGQFLSELGVTPEKVERAYLASDGPTSEYGLFQLDKYGKDLVELAKKGKIQPAIGREVEIGKLAKILTYKTKPNALMRGEPGTGKTQIVEGFAYTIAHSPEQLPEDLRNAKVYALDLGALIGGAKFRGEFEDRIKFVLQEAEKADGFVVLFFDEAHVLAKLGGGEGGADALNLLKPVLSRGNIHCIFATTVDEYRAHLESDGAIERRFQFLDIPPSTLQETILILKGIRESYERHHGIQYSTEALVTSARLSERYIHNKAMPDKAIGPIDNAGSMLKLEHAGFKPEEIAKLEKELQGIQVEIDLLSGDDPAVVKQRAALTEQADVVEQKLHGWRTAFSETQAVLPKLLEIDGTLNQLRPNLSVLRADGAEAIGEEWAVELSRHGVMVTANTVEAEAYAALIKEMQALSKEYDRLVESIAPHRQKYGLGYTTVQPVHVARAISETTGLPFDIIAQGDKERFLQAASILRRYVKYQDHAIDAVSDQFNNRASGLGDPNRPIGSFIFLGPTGVGKTLLAKSVAKHLFGDPEALVQLNMSDYQDARTAVSGLLGATAGYVGHGEKSGQGKLTEPIRQRPFTVVLVDEMDKAPAEVYTIFLTALETGFIQDSSGRMVDMRNTVVILNGNLTKAQLEAKIRPEVLGRFDDVVEFNSIDIEKMKGVASTVFEEHRTRMLEAGVDVVLSEAALSELARLANEDELGIRRLNNAITRQIITPLSRAKNKNALPTDQAIEIGFENGAFTFGGVCIEALERIAK